MTSPFDPSAILRLLVRHRVRVIPVGGMKTAAGRPQDRVELEILAAVKEKREKLGA